MADDESDDMTPEEHKEKLIEWVSAEEDSYPDTRLDAVGDAVKAFNDAGVFGSVELDAETAIRIWAMVETVSGLDLPRRLRA